MGRNSVRPWMIPNTIEIIIDIIYLNNLLVIVCKTMVIQLFYHRLTKFISLILLKYNLMSYNLILVPFLALILAQLIKVIIDSSQGKFSWRNFNNYGGMPSSHSAMVAALATELGLTFGFASGYFAIAFAFAFLTVRDAVGLRYQLGYHGKIMNKIIKDLPDKQEANYPYLQERLGHTYVQALAGIVLGIVVSLII